MLTSRSDYLFAYVPIKVAANAPAGVYTIDWEVVTLSGVPSSGTGSAAYTFTDGGNKGTITITVGDAAPATYNVTVQNDGHGTASADPTSGAAGTEITLSATPNSGYRFKQWNVLSGDVTVNNNKFTMPENDVTVKAIFEKIPATAISGTVEINGTPKYGETLTAVISGVTPSGATVGYQWYRGEDAVTGATGSTYTTVAADIGQSITVKVVGTGNYTGTVTSDAVTISKADAAAPAAPTADTIAETSVTLNVVDGMEYAYSTSNTAPSSGWSTNNSFTGLSANTTYYFFARKAETDTHNVSPASTGTPVTTAKTAISGTVAISGTPKYGETLTAAYTGNATSSVSYQWFRNESPIGTGSTYTTVADDIDQYITVVVTGTGNYTGTVTSAAVAVVKADGPAAPVLDGVAPTTQGGSDGKITGLDTGKLYEYKLSGAATYTPVAAGSTQITDLAEGTYLVRVAATDTREAGTDAIVTVSDGLAATVNGISVNSTTHKTAYKVGEELDVSNLTILVDMSYGTDPTVDVTSAMVSGFNSSAVAAEQTLTITYQGKTTTYKVSISKADGPAAPVLDGVAPTTQNGTDGKITGLNSALVYEYKLSTADQYTLVDAGSTEIISLAAGTYDVRVAATDTHEAGSAAQVDVDPYTEAPATTHTITFDANGGSCSTASLTTNTDGTLSSLPSASRSGYTFDGWYTAKVGGTKISTSYVFSADATVYAHWSSNGDGYVPPVIPRYYTLTFDVNGGSALDGISEVFGTTIDLTGYTTTREGYTFSGWYSDAALTNKVTSVKLTKNTTVYAGWTKSVVPTEGCNGGADCPSKKFTDVDQSQWYHEDVDYVVVNDLMNGTGLTTFEPLATTTRGMIVTILYRMEGEPDTAGLDNPFTDLTQDWYVDAVKWAAANGIVEGYGDNKYGPEDPITREQMATILWRYAKYKGIDVSSGNGMNIEGFADDEQISNYAVDAMKWVIAEGIIGGRPGGVLDPTGNAQRCEVAAIIHRFCELIEK